jgi:hypothetical protein
VKSVNGATHRSNAYYDRVVLGVKRLLLNKGFVAPIDLFVSLDLVDPTNISKWRAGNIDYFERIIRCNLSKTSQIMRVLKFHALEIGLRPSSSVYIVKATKNRLDFQSREILLLSWPMLHTTWVFRRS